MRVEKPGSIDSERPEMMQLCIVLANIVLVSQCSQDKSLTNRPSLFHDVIELPWHSGTELEKQEHMLMHGINV